MVVLIFLSLLLFLAGTYAANALILHWLTKIYKLEKPDLRRAFKIVLYYGIIYIIGVLVISLIALMFKVPFLADIFSLIFGFYILNYFLQKYYKSQWSVSLRIYLVLVLAGIVASIVLLLPFRYYVAEPFYMESENMEPLLFKNDLMFVKKMGVEYKRGGIAVFQNPKNDRQVLTGRIIGLPGEKMAIKENAVYVNELLFDESKYLAKDIKTAGEAEVVLGADEYYVLGDNRGQSIDSRNFGPVKEGLLRGEVFFYVGQDGAKVLGGFN